MAFVGGKLAELLGMDRTRIAGSNRKWDRPFQELADAAGVETARTSLSAIAFRGGKLAELLGMTEQELQAAIESGQTIQELADAAGVELPARP